MPNAKANNFILLQDFGGGIHGRVWLACSTTGKLCVLKFPHRSGSDESLTRERIIWNNIWKIPVFMKRISDRMALVMPFVKPYSEEEGRNDTIKTAVIAAIERMAMKGYIHRDLK